MLIKKHILCLLFTILLLIAKGQEWTVYNNLNSALPNNQIHSIAIQKNGIKWIGTESGLARFDAITWTIFNSSNSALPSSYITAIVLGKSNDIWIGTDKGLVQYNGVSWKIYTTQNSALNRNTISKLYWDARNETLWIATEIGLVKYDGTNWANMETSNPNFAEELICSIETDNAGNLWIGSFDHFQFQGRLWQYDGASWKRYKLEDYGLSSSFPTSIVAEVPNSLWVTTKGTMGGFLVQVKNGNWNIINNLSLNCLEAGVNSISFEANKKWLATGAGLVRYTDTNCISYTTRNSGLPDNYLSCIVIDNNGDKWIGTINGGVAIFKDSTLTERPITNDFSIYPNPVTTSATFSLELLAATHVTIQLFNESGQLVETFFNQNLAKGKHSFIRRFLKHAKGIYYCSLLYDKIKVITKSIFIN